jgi:glycerol-3-phosphate acyltransferase PlsY
MVIAFSPYVALIAIALWVIVLLISRYVSLASIFAVLISTGLIWATPLQIWWFTKIPFTSLWGVFVIFLIAGCYIIYRHKANIGRIFKKTETKAFSKK